jgi:mono/diheme cytochrome c family protein
MIATPRTIPGLVARTLAAASIVLSFAPARAADGPAEAKRIFNQRCTACHTYGKGVKVGPDLKGVTERRKRPWLLKFIRSSQGVIQGGDSVAKGLFTEFKQQRMPDWTDLSEVQINAILDWFAAAGPEQKEPDERNAEVATAAEVETGRRLFQGQAAFTYGGMACASCHSIRDNGVTKGGTLGPTLTNAYLKFQDRALTLFFRKPCFRRAPEPQAGHYLTPQESFALKAYLRQAALSGRAGALASSGESTAAPPRGGENGQQRGAQ